MIMANRMAGKLDAHPKFRLLTGKGILFNQMDLY